MRRLRGFCKRKFGTAPTIIGTHAQRRAIEDAPTTVTLVCSMEDSILGQGTDEIQSNIFQVGETIVLRGSDGYTFNALQLTKSYQLEVLQPTTKLKGNFLIPEEPE